MLNTFPNLLTYGLFAPLLLRLALGIFLVFTSYKSLRGQISNISRGAEIVLAIAGVFIVIGLFTQVMALLVLIISAATFVYKWKVVKSLLEKDIMLYVFVIVISISLMLSGAGFYAIDLPL